MLGGGRWGKSTAYDHWNVSKLEDVSMSLHVQHASLTVTVELFPQWSWRRPRNWDVSRDPELVPAVAKSRSLQL